jgi:hypothetical protein
MTVRRWEDGSEVRPGDALSSLRGDDQFIYVDVVTSPMTGTHHLVVATQTGRLVERLPQMLRCDVED